MATSALEEKINKIRQQNEEIRRRHEEVEEDKKNAAKLNALVQMVPSTDWPERKEPPEFSNPPRTNNKSKSTKEHHEHPQQHHSASGEGRKVHTFAQGQGPPPDPKYNFLADAEREEGNTESPKDNPPNKGQKHSKGTFKRKPGGKDGLQKDYRMNRGHRRDEHQPEYEAWRAERNRIDEDRISRQRTAEGNWRREWDNDKAHIVNEMTRSEAKLGDYAKKEHKDFDRRHHVNGNDYVSHNRSGYRSYRGNSKHFHNNYENRSNNAYHQEGHVKNPVSSSSEDRTVIATDKSIKVTLNQGKGPVMSVKVNSPSIAGTGRVGPRQRSRITYSSHSDVEMVSPDTESFSRPKSYEDKTKGIYHDNQQKFSNSRKSQPPKKKDFSNKSPYFRKKEIRREDVNENPQEHKVESPQEEEHKESQKSDQFKLQKPEENNVKSLQNDNIVNEKENNAISSDELDTNTDVKNSDNQNDSLNSYIDEKSEVYTNEEGEFILQDSDLPVSKDEIEICKISEEVKNKLDESQIVQTAIMSEYNEITDLTVSLVKDINDNDRDKTKSVGNLSCDANDEINETVMGNEEHNSSTEQIEEILSDNCDSKQTEDTDEQENDIKLNTESSAEEKKGTDNLIISSSTDVSSIMEQNNKMDSDDKSLEEKEVVTVEDKVTVIDDKINTSNKEEVIKYTNETKECKDDNNENGSNAANSIVIDKVESQEEDLRVEEVKVALSKMVETKE